MGVIKKILGLVGFALFALSALAQQPQSQTAPLQPYNAKYVDGVGIGYWPTPGSGLTLNIAAGTNFCSGAIVTYSGGTLTMSNNTTNYVYLNEASSCVPASNTSGFSSSNLPIATVVTSGGSITSVTDDRTLFVTPGSGGGGSPGGSTYAMQYNAGSSMFGGVNSPSVNGQYGCGFTITGSAATAPTCSQVGLAARAVTGTTSTDTITYADNNSNVRYEGSVSVAVTLPTPTTLTNSNFFTTLKNSTTGSLTTVTVTPMTWTINGSSSFVMPDHSQCAVYVDPGVSTNWVTTCADALGTLNGVSIASLSSGLLYITTSTGIPSIATPHQVALPLQCADTSSSSTTYTCATTPSIGSLTTGDTFKFTSINQNNSGSSTLNIDGIGAKTLKKYQNTANLASGDLQAGSTVWVTYDGTYLEVDTIGNAPSGSGTVSSCSTTNAIGIYGTATSTTIGCGDADFTYTTHTLAAGSSGILDLHSASSTSDILLPGAFSTGVLSVTTSTGAITSNTGTQYGILDWATSGTLGQACTPPTTNGVYTVEYNITGAAAAQATCPLVGLVQDQAAGATVLYSDNNNVIYAPASALSLPTPTTLANSNFYTVLVTNGTASTVTPVTWTISLNGAAAGSSAICPAYSRCTITVDQVASTQWDMNTPSGYVNGAAVPASATVAGTNSSSQITAAALATGKWWAGSSNLPVATFTPTLGVSGTAGTISMFPATGNFTTTWGSAATASNTILGFASVPTTNHLVSCVVSSTTCTMTDSGVVAGNVVTASSPGAGLCHFAGSTQACTSSAVVGSDMTNNTVTATQLAAQYSKGSCTELWGGSGTSFALTSGDDAISDNSCYNDSGVTRTITAVKCRSDNSSNTTTVNPTFGSAGTGTTILSGALTCGNSYAYSSSGTVSNASWTTGSGVTPAMGGTLTGTSIAMIVEYTY